MTQRRAWILFFCSSSIIILVGVCVGVWASTHSANIRNHLKVAFLDVGQGDSIYIETPNNTQVLIDGGADARVMRKLGDVMPWYDRSLDMVIATHPDKDHIGGLLDVVRAYDVSYFLSSKDEGSSKLASDLYEYIEGEKEVNHVYVQRGMRVHLDRRHGVFMDILAPTHQEPFSDSNDGSIIVRLVYGDNEFLLTGDASLFVEQELVYMNKDILRSDVLKLGHHGSHTSSSSVFLDAVQPELAIISAGCDNSYGHPSDVVIERLYERAIPARSTCRSGTITLASDGDVIIVR